MNNLLLFTLLALLAEILGTVGGFGSSLFFVPLASFFLDFHSVLGITALYHVSSNIAKIIFFRKGFRKDLVIKIGIPAVLFVITGAWLSNYFASDFLEAGIGVVLIALSLIFLFAKQFSLKPNVLNAVAGGAVSGFLAGMFGTGGAIRGITLTAFNLDMNSFIATSALIDLGIDSSRSVVYSINGYVHQSDLLLIFILFVVSFIGTFIGKYLLRFVSEKNFRSIVLLLILLTGIITVYRQFA